MTDEGREPLRFLVLAASLRAGSLNARLANLAATVAKFMDVVEASTHYPRVKRAWVEFLGEQPDPAVDRVEV